MKKNKREIILSVLIVVFIGAAIFCYSKSKTIISTDEIPYSENGKVNYKVYLNSNKYYNTDFLGENMQYISSIIKNITLNYDYSADYENIKNYKVIKKVNAQLLVYDHDKTDNVIYKKDDILKDETTNLEQLKINDTIVIDYGKYNSLTNEFKTSYGISAECKLTVTYYLVYENEDSSVKRARTFTVEIPLSEQMINITKSSDINENSVYIGQTKDSDINRLMLTLTYICGGLALVCLGSIVMGLRKKAKLESKFDRFIKKVLREYDSYITEAKEGSYSNSKSVISINSFKELIDVRNNVDKAIVYVKVNDDVSKFLIIDDEVYEYVARREDFEK